jgi:chromate transporter
MPPARLTEVTRLFFRVGTTVFGGGFTAIAILQREFDRRGWLSPQKTGLAFALARLTPGTNFLAFCAATGWYLAGFSGAVAAMLGSTISGAVLVIWIAQAGELGNAYPWARAVISALVAAGVGTMLGAAVVLVRSQCSRKQWLRPLTLAAAAFVLSSGLRLSPLWVIGIIAAVGFFWAES